MKKHLIVPPLSIFLSIFLFFNCLAQTPVAYSSRGEVIEGATAPSRILNKKVKYSIYFPADYESSSRLYPVVYLLHGYSGGEEDWVQSGEVNRIADKLIAAGELPDCIIVMPDAENTWYVNAPTGQGDYEDFFFKEFIPFIDKTYQTRAERGYRAIVGLSMGGYGATLYALKHTDKFVAAAGLSGAYFTDAEMENGSDAVWSQYFAAIYGANLAGKARISKEWQQNSVFNLIEKTPVEDLNKTRWYFDCGDDDFLFRGNAALHVELAEKKVKHEFRMRDGGHTWSYWRTGIGEALKFLGESFRH
ncbi:MAG: alpha/beta hydrolase family protein [Saprospiraceae bacterium]|nr:alpha/beta hydrolase family protein [Saprospiraceae bacterium]